MKPKEPMVNDTVKVGIVIEDYKRKTFRAALEKAGFVWDELPGIKTGTKLLQVKCPFDRVQELAGICKTANTLSRRVN